MRVVTKTEFSQLTAVELMAVTEDLQITSNKTVIGYFVPPSMWHEYELALADARAALEGDDGKSS
jgi:hypothetical protein